MSNCIDLTSDQVCYIPCNFCNIILAVSVPSNSLFDIVTVRCGHCTNLWSVNMAAALQPMSWQGIQSLLSFTAGAALISLLESFVEKSCQSGGSSLDGRDDNRFSHFSILVAFFEGMCRKNPSFAPPEYRMELASSSKCNKVAMLKPTSSNVERTVINRAPEKKQRVPSAYNQFIKEEIQRIKANNPEITHKEAFSTAAKNWAHFPHIHFGLMLENNKAKLNQDLRGI